MMKNLSKYLPWIVAGVLFFVGRISAPKPDEELIRKYELERKTLMQSISEKEARIKDLTSAGFTIRKKMVEDSLKTANALRANNEAYLRLKKRYNEINLNRASSVQLDSLVEVLFPD